MQMWTFSSPRCGGGLRPWCAVCDPVPTTFLSVADKLDFVYVSLLQAFHLGSESIARIPVHGSGGSCFY